MPTVSTYYVYFAAVTLVAHDNSILVATRQTPDDVRCLPQRRKPHEGKDDKPPLQWFTTHLLLLQYDTLTTGMRPPTLPV